ncbi:MAG: hypothetical protein AAGA03_05215 [Planctomycetota bacterium]
MTNSPRFLIEGMMLPSLSRRQFLQSTGSLAALGPSLVAQASEVGKTSSRVKVIHPAGRVPLSFVIDDSTCLVNMGHFCTPQFAAAYPKRAIYQRPWRAWPREIPDSFVREFGTWCAEQGVKGKYSVVPNPACVGWIDRLLPGWSRQQLQDSLKLVRELMMPNWDIHPEMITHTRVIDLKTGRPVGEISPSTMENSYPQTKQSVDELASYLAYALRILERCDLPCSGITTPGGFGNRVKQELSLAVQQAVDAVFSPEIVHYFKYVQAGDQSTEPQLENVRGVGTDRLQLTVNVPAGTGDWFGGWQGVEPSDPDRYCNEEATSGRIVDLIQKGMPAVMLCHWPGMYCNGSKQGFQDFQRIVRSLATRFGGSTKWMKLSEIARYWCAKELTTVAESADGIRFDAPYSAPEFTIERTIVADEVPSQIKLVHHGNATVLRRVDDRAQLMSDTWCCSGETCVVCLDLPKGASMLRFDRR